MPEPIPVTGVLLREGELTGDGRRFEVGSIQWSSEVLPLPIIFDRDDGDHTGATIGRIDTVWRDGSDIRGSGVLSASNDPAAQAAVDRAAELLDEDAIGVSVAVDAYRGDIRINMDAFPDIEDEDGTIRIPIAYDDITLSFSEARLRHLAIVDTPAFPTAALSREQQTGVLVASAAIDGSHYFNAPEFGAPGSDERLKYDPNTGRWSCPPTLRGDHYFGHVAPMGICLRGRPDRCLTPPEGDLEGFMRAYAPAAGGKRTGVVVIGGEHATPGIGAEAATKHYDKTGRAAADIRVGRDAYGIWFSGMVRPGCSKNDRYALAASDVSGHWEMGQRGVPTLVGLPAVNVGGYPKGYLSAEEVASGIAASGHIEETEDCGCGCDEAASHGDEIDLEYVLAFMPDRSGA